MKLRAFVLPALSVLAYLALWFVPPPRIVDPWNEAITLVNDARAAQDPARKRELLDRAGAMLGEMVQSHPYHARVQFVASYYYNDVGDNEAAIVHAKEAIRLGSGARVNQVDGIAREVLVDASLKKAQALINGNDLRGARTVLDDAQAIDPASPRLAAARDVLARSSGAPR